MTSSHTRRRMVKRLHERGIGHAQVLAAMERIPRHLFVDQALAQRAYDDVALPIGLKQTISQPYVVARMVELALGEAGAACTRVLEIGTGCGYQAAVLGQLFGQVYTIERIGPLLDAARDRLRSLFLLKNLTLRHSDGFLGWPDAAPFDAIVMAAAPRETPTALLVQLAPGGRMIFPKGDGKQQVLCRIERTLTAYVEDVLESVHFVPMLPGFC